MKKLLLSAAALAAFLAAPAAMADPPNGPDDNQAKHDKADRPDRQDNDQNGGTASGSMQGPAAQDRDASPRPGTCPTGITTQHRIATTATPARRPTTSRKRAPTRPPTTRSSTRRWCARRSIAPGSSEGARQHQAAPVSRGRRLPPTRRLLCASLDLRRAAASGVLCARLLDFRFRALRFDGTVDGVMNGCAMATTRCSLTSRPAKSSASNTAYPHCS